MNPLEEAAFYNKDYVLYPVLKAAVALVQPRSYLEIGVNVGASLMRVLSASRETALPGAGHGINRLLLCDTWGWSGGGWGKGSHAHIEVLLNQIGYRGMVDFLDGDSKLTLPEFMSKTREQFDLILVDGDHSKMAAYLDMCNCWSLLRVGGLMVVDDLEPTENPEVLPAFDLFLSQTLDAVCTVRETKLKSGAGVVEKRR